MPMQPPKPTVPTSLPMYFMVSKSAKQGTTCSVVQTRSGSCHALRPPNTTRFTEPAVHRHAQAAVIALQTPSTTRLTESR